jgi:hypothetical protein
MEEFQVVLMVLMSPIPSKGRCAGSIALPLTPTQEWLKWTGFKGVKKAYVAVPKSWFKGWSDVPVVLASIVLVACGQQAIKYFRPLQNCRCLKAKGDCFVTAGMGNTVVLCKSLTCCYGSFYTIL